MTPQEQNENSLGELMENADREFMALVGVVGLGIMAQQMSPEDYQAFLSDCVENAHGIQRVKAFQGKAKR